MNASPVAGQGMNGGMDMAHFTTPG
jgi:hypothetical protein